MTGSTRPVVALDFDGTLNPETSTVPIGYGMHQVELKLPDGARPPYLRADSDGVVSGSVLINPAHGRWITDLRQHAKVVWSTSWEWAANAALAPLLGIEALPLGVDSAVLGPKFRQDSPDWKAWSLLCRYGEDRPLVWVDDHAGWWAASLEPPAPSEDFLSYLKESGLSLADFDFTSDRWRSGPTLVIAPDPAIGLTAEQMRQIDSFVRSHG